MAKILIVVLVIINFAVQIYDNYRSERENGGTSETAAVEEAAEEEDEHTELSDVIYENKTHIILFLGLTADLAVVKHQQIQQLKESK